MKYKNTFIDVSLWYTLCTLHDPQVYCLHRASCLYELFVAFIHLLFTHVTLTKISFLKHSDALHSPAYRWQISRTQPMHLCYTQFACTNQFFLKLFLLQFFFVFLLLFLVPFASYSSCPCVLTYVFQQSRYDIVDYNFNV